MGTEMGEHLVGAYLKYIKKCDFVDYNVRPSGGGLAGLGELDVVGLDFKNSTAYICEVSTHLQGIRNVNIHNDKIKKKYERQKEYAKNSLKPFSKKEFMFWSPIVRPGIVIELKQIKGLKLVINKDYSRCINELQTFAADTSRQTDNPAFRLLQILSCMKQESK